MAINTYLSIITLNIKWLNSPNDREDEWIKNKTYLYAAFFVCKDIHWLKVKGWKKIFHANGNQKKAGVLILISDKIDLKIKTVVRDKGGHYIIIKGKNTTRVYHICKCLCNQQRST